MSSSSLRRHLAAALAALAPIGCVLVSSALAAPGCPSSQSTSANGKIVYGSPCADTIVVTSPEVEEVFAGEGDDVIYANPNVEAVYGGEGDDVIYGDLEDMPASRIDGGPEPGAEEAEGGIDYETAEPEASTSNLRAGRRNAPVATASNTVECTESPCYGGDGNQEMFGGPGADVMFGQRGNDTLHGEAGNDKLDGGIGDDTLYGNGGYDELSGGLGTDTIDGNNGNDFVRGDGTIDVIKDTGSAGDTDTISFATAVTPGFRGPSPVPGFPGEGFGEERGVEVRLDGNPSFCGLPACNYEARYGGGDDRIEVSGFENVFGSPFADHIVGSAGDNRIDGGGGTDVLEGGGGNDALIGGADYDYMSGGPGTDRTFFAEEGENSCAADVETRRGCTSTAAEVHQRDRSRIEVGFVSPPVGELGQRGLYLLGSEGADLVNVQAPVKGFPNKAVFTLEPGSAQFDVNPGLSASSPNCSYAPTEVACPLPGIDSVTLAGMGGDDKLNLAGNNSEWPQTVTPVLLGGEGNDTLIGSGGTEDVLVDGDGPGNDTLYGYGLDDALLNNEGADNLQAGAGSDLLLSATTCDGDVLQGAEGKRGDKEDVNNASWSQLPSYAGGVVADLGHKTAGSQFTEVIITSATQEAQASAAKGGEKGGGGKGGGGGKDGGGKGEVEGAKAVVTGPAGRRAPRARSTTSTTSMTSRAPRRPMPSTATLATTTCLAATAKTCSSAAVAKTGSPPKTANTTRSAAARATTSASSTKAWTR